MKYFLFILTACLFIACNGDIWGREPAVASFKVLNNECDAPCKVTFINTSKGNANTYAWFFGSAGTSTEENPEHLFNLPGLYDINLLASNSGSFSSTTQKIEIKEPQTKPMVNFEIIFSDASTGQSCLSPCYITLNNKTIGANATYFWDFGDGNTSTQKNPQHSFGTDGNFVITLTATNQYGTSSLSKTLRVFPNFSKVKLRSITLNSIFLPLNTYDADETYPHSCPDLYITAFNNTAGSVIIQNRDIAVLTDVQSMPCTLYNLHDVDVNLYGYYAINIMDYDDPLFPQLDEYVATFYPSFNNYTQFIEEVTYPDNTKHWIANVPLQELSSLQGILTLEYFQ